jgi:hypothetical protein
MRSRQILCITAVFLISHYAEAKLPLPNDSLGKIEGTLDFCAQANPKAAQKYMDRKKGIVGDALETEVTEARNTQEYKDAYQEISDQLAKAPKSKAVKACSDFLAGE